jgi:hypothetical protein
MAPIWYQNLQIKYMKTFSMKFCIAQFSKRFRLFFLAYITSPLILMKWIANHRRSFEFIFLRKSSVLLLLFAVGESVLSSSKSCIPLISLFWLNGRRGIRFQPEPSVSFATKMKWKYPRNVCFSCPKHGNLHSWKLKKDPTYIYPKFVLSELWHWKVGQGNIVNDINWCNDIAEWPDEFVKKSPKVLPNPFFS